MHVAAIIVGGGRGRRLGGEVPKQLLDIGGRSLLRWSVEAFDRHPRVNEIVVVLPGELVPEGQALIGPTMGPCAVVAGGARRQDSVRSGLAAVSANAGVVLVHDAARPFVSAAVIDRVIAAAEATGAAVPAVPVRDTVKRVAIAGDGTRVVRETVPREEVWLAQTPQGFSREVLAAAVAAADRGPEATDDAMLVEAAGRPVQLVDGDAENVKVTTMADLMRARAAVAGPSRVGTGYDLHRLVAGRSLVLAGVHVPFERGPEGHSDGDVVCHALTDAVLGAAGCGDIGQQFPNTDDRWKDAPGLDLLARALTVVRAEGWRVTNADVTVVLERPRLAPHLAEVRERLAVVLGVPVSAISVKGKTNEGVDATGRGEAIAAHAVAMLSAEAGS